MRLNRFLASCGVGSRRGCEEFIRHGRVEINGKIITDLATRVEETDHVKFDGKLLRTASALTLVLNKPEHCLCTRSDPQGRRTVYDLLPSKFGKLHHVGRLDNQSCGLILLTSDGKLNEQLTHPRHHVEKEYYVQLDHPFDKVLLDRLLNGIHLSEGLAKADSVRFETRRRLNLVLSQGYNRQIRRMFEEIGYEVRGLERVRIGSLTMPMLDPGKYEVLDSNQILAASRNPEPEQA